MYTAHVCVHVHVRSYMYMYLCGRTTRYQAHTCTAIHMYLCHAETDTVGPMLEITELLARVIIMHTTCMYVSLSCIRHTSIQYRIAFCSISLTRVCVIHAMECFLERSISHKPTIHQLVLSPTVSVYISDHKN